MVHLRLEGRSVMTVTGTVSPGWTRSEFSHFTSSLAGGGGLNTSDTADQSDCQPEQGEGRDELSWGSQPHSDTYLQGELGTAR